MRILIDPGSGILLTLDLDPGKHPGSATLLYLDSVHHALSVPPYIICSKPVYFFRRCRTKSDKPG
jgi:hypothetical protein